MPRQVADRYWTVSGNVAAYGCVECLQSDEQLRWKCFTFRVFAKVFYFFRLFSSPNSMEPRSLFRKSKEIQFLHFYLVSPTSLRCRSFITLRVGGRKELKNLKKFFHVIICLRHYRVYIVKNKRILMFFQIFVLLLKMSENSSRGRRRIKMKNDQNFYNH